MSTGEFRAHPSSSSRCNQTRFQLRKRHDCCAGHCAFLSDAEFCPPGSGLRPWTLLRMMQGRMGAAPGLGRKCSVSLWVLPVTPSPGPGTPPGVRSQPHRRWVRFGVFGSRVTSVELSSG